MDEYLKQFIAERCNKALAANEEYLKLDYDDNSDPVTLQGMSNELCYKKGFLDAMALIFGK